MSCLHAPVDVDAIDVKVLNEGEESFLDVVEGSLLPIILRSQHLGGVGVSCVPSDVGHYVLSVKCLRVLE